MVVGVSSVATRDDLPETAVEGDTRVVLDEKVIVVFKGGDWNNINIGVEDIEGFIDALDFLVEHAETQSGNPHNVTAEEVGAYTKEAVDQRLSAVDQKLDNVDQELEAVDLELGEVNQKLVTVDEDLEAVDQRLGSIDQDLDAVDQRLVTVDGQLGVINEEARCC